MPEAREGMGRERVCLPFPFLVKSAQGHLKKANFLKKSSMHSQELHYLKKLEVLVASTMPAHPLYEENKYDKLVLEFESQVEETRSRIEELERKSRVVPKLQKPSILRSRIEKLASSRADNSSHKEAADDACSSDSSLRSKLTESVKLLSPDYSPRRLEKCLKAAARGSCLELEASLRGKEWLKLELDGLPEGSEADDELKENHGWKNTSQARNKRSEAQEQQQKKDDEPREYRNTWKLENPEFRNKSSEIQKKNDELPQENRAWKLERNSGETQEQHKKDDSGTGLTSLYRKYFGSGNSGGLVQEFRHTLRVLESSTREKAGFAQELSRHSEKVIRPGKGENEDFVSDFMASTRNLLSKGATLEQQETPAPALKWTSPEPSKVVSPQPRARHPRASRADAKTGDVESLVEAKVDKMFSEMMGTLVAGTEQALSCIKSELENAREVGSQLKSETENLKKLNEFKLNEFQEVLGKAQKEGSDMKAQVHGLKKLEQSLRHDTESLRKMFDRIDRDGAARKQELQEIRREQEVLCNRILAEGEGDKAVIMERIEKLSQQYIGRLEDVRAEVSGLKAGPELMARAETLLAEMRNRRKKSMQLESVMKNAVEAALKLEEKYGVELEKARDSWSWAMNLQIGEAKAVLGELTEQSRALSAHLGGFEGHSVVISRIQSIEGEVRQLVSGVRPPLNELAIYESIAKHREVIGQELSRFDEQIQEALRKLEGGHENESVKSEMEEKLKEVVKSREKISEMGKKVRKLEGSQLNLVRSVEELRTSTSDLEVSASTWLPKYENASGLLKAMDARLGVAERLIKGIEAGQARKSGDELQTRAKFGTLEDRVEHVASETLGELRVLDSKVEQCRAGVQSALDGAAQAENKCSVLGAEIVKVFRMFAAKSGKLTELPGAKPGPSLFKEKSPLSCKSCCKRASTDEAPPGAVAAALRRIATGVGYSPADEPGLKRGSEGSSFIESYAETLYQSGRLNSRFTKTPAAAAAAAAAVAATQDDDEDELASPRMKCSRGRGRARERKEPVKGFQRTNIRLEAGKVVPVPH